MSEPAKNPLEPLEPFFEEIRRIVREEIGALKGELNGQDRSHPPTLLTVQELAEALKVKKSWIYDLTRKKKNSIPHLRVGRYPRFELSKVLSWLEAQKKS